MSAVVVFEIGASRFALPRRAVARILPAPRLTRPPAAPAALAGFFALGPALVTVLRFHVLTGIERADEPRLHDHLVLLKAEGPPIALLVDRVSDVVAFDEQQARSLAAGSSHRDSIVAEIDARGAGALLVDPAKLIADYEKERVRCFHDEERRRRGALGDAA